MREAGLPLVVSDIQGEQRLLKASKGVVRAVYPELWRVDLETEEGAVLRGVPVIGPLLPELHEDSKAPQHVGYLHVRGSAHAFCWPLTHRRLMGPYDTMEGTNGADQPERRYFHTHSYILRSGDVTIRITRDHRLVFETEEGDFIQLNTKTREVHISAPTLLVQSGESENRLEFNQDDIARLYDPLVLIGSEVGDRIELRRGVECLIEAPVIKLTATESITLDPPRINFGDLDAGQRMILGDLFQSYINTVVKPMIDNHVHQNVQNGPGISGTPTTSYPSMDNSLLSTIVRTSV